MSANTELKSLGYIGVRSDKLADWSEVAVRLLGMQPVDQAKSLRTFRMDDRKQRYIVSNDGADGLGFMGWEVEAQSDLGSLASRLEAAGTAVAHGSRALAEQRRVADLITFADPGGNRLEVFWKPEVADTPFVPGRPISGFRTGPLGMGHVVLNVSGIDRLLPFYRDLLGFGISDYSLKPYKLYFFHVNGRHHSFAMVESGKQTLHHFMVELGSLDDVGQGYDLAQTQADRIAYSLGRHTNDHMTSFYMRTPSDFFIEYGWGGRVIDPATWQPHETFDGPSFWGHERLNLPPEQRDSFRQMRLDAAARGVRAPVNCAWLEQVRHD
ncbi:VOC family protein [Bradyrhizobium sp. LHD-71]|uniref:VOC family protein n=1 Tax=Bradyrhizobium sp. LHD-71 TaxID=3072141 RepID=UPI00280CCA9D|nr:VOC family protein [Bradyrhizobium sp. LHD-71]MDQ8731046.1 VOC family protein [Bradyrhizobium sp. LHD-71]